MGGYRKPGFLRSLPLTFAVSAVVMGISTASGLSQQSGVTAAGGVDGIATEAVSRSTLKPGSKGNDVTELQATLKLLGFYNGAVDGVYGQTTVNAVYSFQQAAGLDADGIAGPATWGRLFPATPVGVAPPSSLVSRPSPSRAANPAATSPSPITPLQQNLQIQRQFLASKWLCTHGFQPRSQQLKSLLRPATS
jgi:Putative peptidoglycan-binding domain-containing protein